MTFVELIYLTYTFLFLILGDSIADVKFNPEDLLLGSDSQSLEMEVKYLASDESLCVISTCVSHSCVNFISFPFQLKRKRRGHSSRVVHLHWLNVNKPFILHP